MYLNSLTLGIGTKPSRKRVGRGISSGSGKTCGRGHKGQHSRSGGYHKLGFEGGQNPLVRRVPKCNFRSRLAFITNEIHVHDLLKCEKDVIDVKALQDAKIISRKFKRVKVIGVGDCNRTLSLKGIRVTKSARQAIEATGGVVEV